MSPPATALDRDESPSARQSALADNESMFRQLFERSADAMFLSDPRREIFVDCNQAALEMMRARSKEQLLLMNPADLSPEFQPDGRSSRERVHEDTTLTLRHGSHRFEWRGRRMDGTEFPIEVLLTRIQSGEQTLVAAVCRDITERKRAERELLELTQTLERRGNARPPELSASEARFSVAFQASPFFIGILRMSDGAYVLANDAFVNWLGYPREKVIGRSSAEFGLWENVDERASALNDMRNIGSIRQREVHWQNRHGERLTILLSAETINLNDIPHILSFAQDITQRKRAEEEL